MTEKKDKLLKLDVVTPSRTMVADEVGQINAPGIDGDLGIMYDHAAFLTNLRPGSLSYQKGEETVSMVIAGGYLEVAENRIIILAESAEFLNEIDRERALKAKVHAESLLEKENLTDSEFREAQLKLFRAIARLDHSSEE
tara:strand:+ start:275 stop:694 length:420 start_codon:yes stop_codon:yes gene_type:complete